MKNSVELHKTLCELVKDHKDNKVTNAHANVQAKIFKEINTNKRNEINHDDKKGITAPIDFFKH